MATPTMKETTIFSEDLQLLLHSVILIYKSNLSQIENKAIYFNCIIVALFFLIINLLGV